MEKINRKEELVSETRCRGSRAWSILIEGLYARDSRSRPEGVHGFKSHPLHHLANRKKNVMPAMSSKLFESFGTLAKDSKSILIEYLTDRVGHVRFFSYGSNMNKKKFKDDMEEATKKLKLKLSEKGKTKLELDEFSEKRVLVNFKRELSNESARHSRAFSIHFSLGSKVEGICHDVHVSVLPAFLKKEGLLSSKPSYKLIKVCVSGEDQEVLTLIGLKPNLSRILKRKYKMR